MIHHFLLTNFNYLFLLATITVMLSLISILLILKFTKKFNIVDDPTSANNRKFQFTPIPLLGGTGPLIVGLIICLSIWYFRSNNFIPTYLFDNLTTFKFLYVILASFLLLFVGFLDDKYQLKPQWQFVSILTAISIVVFLGNIRIESLTNFNEVPFFLSIIITFAWIGFSTASTKFLDGHDGLVTIVGILNLLTIGSIALLEKINQPFIFVITLIIASCLTPFLYYNFPEAKIYLGEGASELIGFLIGVFAILSGAKLATALSILGWFILDIFLVWYIRIRKGKNPITYADRSHWHYRLLAFGMNKIQVLVITIIILLVSSFVGIYGNSTQKIGLIIFQAFALMIIYKYTPKNL
jgi:UDP-GlcNAc:undecaprenyl-phosphate/decaprenyl-phosphate GlcNAc-1-phosphate transferase